MKKIINNKYVLFAFAFTLGAILIWFIKPSSHQYIESSTNQTSKNTVFTCSMHPQIRQNEPGSCPICGMDLIPLEDDNGEGIDPMAITMSPTAMQLANVVTANVGSESAMKTIRLNGKVQEDERLIFSQTTHFPGRIEKLAVNFTGEYVSKGSVIASLYSPQLVTAQEELFEAYKIRESQPNLYRAAREKLKNWKLTESQIDQIISSGKTQDQFPVLADQSGYVTTKKVNLGDYVNRGQTLYEIGNLSRVWVQFDVYESDLSWINKGDSIQFNISSLPGQTFKGKIDYVDPVINPKTRVTNARVVVQNNDRILKPEMFASGEVKAQLRKTVDQLTVPKSAVMWTGKRSVVYVKLSSEQGLHFKMREVTLGPSLGDAYIIEKGLEPGEEIAVNGTFSIDAAAQLAGKPSMMSRQTASPEGGAAMTGHNHDDLMSGLPDVLIDVKGNDNVELDAVLTVLFKAYLPIKDALIESDLPKTKKATKSFMSIANQQIKTSANQNIKLHTGAVDQIIESNDLERSRAAFSKLSDQLFHTLKKYQVEVGGYRQYCPMAMDNQGAFWLSDSDKILNPYFGDAMLTCGNVEEHLNESIN
ncbi:MAG: efflux RND transporter periplasmic adaptor subunit [Marinoscillum sp.]